VREIVGREDIGGWKFGVVGRNVTEETEEAGRRKVVVGGFSCFFRRSFVKRNKGILVRFGIGYQSRLICRFLNLELILGFTVLYCEVFLDCLGVLFELIV
jgi:hypothetical protein